MSTGALIACMLGGMLVLAVGFVVGYKLTYDPNRTTGPPSLGAREIRGGRLAGHQNTKHKKTNVAPARRAGGDAGVPHLPRLHIAEKMEHALVAYAGVQCGKPIYPGRGDGVCDNGNVKVFGKIDPSDVRQGSVGDCWLLSAIAALAEYDGAIKHMFRKTRGIEAMLKATLNKVRKTPSWPRSWANFSLL